MISNIFDMNSEIEDLNWNIDESIEIKVLNCLKFFFERFLAIFNNEFTKNKKLHLLESFAKLLEDEKLELKNQDSKTANFIKELIKQKD